MREGWKRIRLGDVFEVSTAKLGAHSEEPAVFAISKYDGVVLSGDYHDRRVASAKLDGYKVLDKNAWAYSTIHIDEGSIARNNHGFAGVVSPMYTILNWVSEDCVPAYFEHLLRTPEMLSTYKDMAQGSINRRCSLPWKSFSAIEVDVPPIDEQQRIVDLIGSLGDAIEAANDTAEAARLSADGVRLGLVSDANDWPRQSISDLTDSIVRCAPAGDSDFSYIDISSVSQTAKKVVEARSIPGNEAPGRARQHLKAGDVLVSTVRPNLNAVAQISDVLDGSVGSTGFSVLRGNATVVPGFLFQIVRSRGFVEAMTERATGTGYPAVTDRIVRGFEVPVPPLDVQRSLVETLESIDGAEAATAVYAESLRATRSELLSVLLSGDHEIPETYDIDTAVQLESAA